MPAVLRLGHDLPKILISQVLRNLRGEIGLMASRVFEAMFARGEMRARRGRSGIVRCRRLAERGWVLRRSLQKLRRLASR